MDRETRELFERFNDEFIKFKRETQDALENLDFDNFSGNFKEYISNANKASAGFTAGADIEKAWAKMFAEYKTGISNTLAEITTKADANNAAISAMTMIRLDPTQAEDFAGSYEELELYGDKSKIYVKRDVNLDNSSGELIVNVTNEVFYYYNDYSQKWEAFDGNSINTVFEQTPEGFKLKGNTIIDGDTVITRNLKLTGNVTWDMSNSPVLSQYTSDLTYGIWHSEFLEGDKFMHISFDGGRTWSNPMKVVGDNGTNGSGAGMSDYDIFNILTNNGEIQGLFPFYEGTDDSGITHLYINAEYINSELSVVKDKLFLGNYIDFPEDYIEANEMSKMLVFNTGAFIGTLADNSDLLKMFSMYIQLAATIITIGDLGTTGVYIGNPSSTTTMYGDLDLSNCNVSGGIPLYFG